MKSIFLFLVTVILSTCNSNVKKLPLVSNIHLTPLSSGIDASCRGIAMTGNQVWVAGSDGTVIRSVDQGATWQRIRVPDADSLDFRDIAILDENTILLMSAGSGRLTRVYKTTDGGKSWKVALQNEHEKAFFNGFDFNGNHQGILVSDPIDDKLYLLHTPDGGESWSRIGTTSLPPLLKTEYGFAASGTGIVLQNDHIWIATGGDQARIFRSVDGGLSWGVHPTPMASGNGSSGIFSIAFRDKRYGIAVGGDYQDPNVDKGNVARTHDGGKTWTRIDNTPPVLHKACVVHLGGQAWLAAGRTGIVMSKDDGLSWELVSQQSYYTIAYHRGSRVGFLAGKDGRVARFVVK